MENRKQFEQTIEIDRHTDIHRDMMADHNRIVLNFHNTLLRESDVNLLMGAHWLNDQIISFYLEYLEQVVFQNTRGLLFISPDVVQCLKFVCRDEMSIFLEPLNAVGKSFIFLPLNDNNEVKAGGNHWSLLVFSRPESTFFYYDSLSSGTSLRSLRPFLLELAAAIDCPEFDIRQGDCVKQNNSYDCGIHVLCNVECLARRAQKHNALDDESMSTSSDEDPTKITHQKVRQKRQDLIDLIRKLGGKV